MNKRHLLLYTICAVLGFANGFVRGNERFDHEIRPLMFAGFGGDQEALERGLRICEEAIGRNPKHAEALVWRGSGLFFLSGQAMRAKDFNKGMDLYTRSMKDMDLAVELEPDNVGVRIPRGAVLLTAASSMDENPIRETIIRKALSDFQHTHDLQASYFASLSTHSRGELLQGLANAYRLLGNKEKASEYYARVAKELAGTPYAQRAEKYLATGSLTARETACIGCHVSGK
jgi:tetratricopeptide (TPR) repeat protein